MRRILIVEDERAIAEVVEFAAQKAGFETRRVATATQARRLIERQRIDLVVLDLGLPDGDGLDLCRELSTAAEVPVPVLILTCRDEEMDRVLGLESGADDYVVKPFSPRELMARIRTILRRVEKGARRANEPPLRLGRVALSTAEHRVTLDAAEVRLTPIEFRLMRTLLAAPTRVFTRDDLIGQLYDDHCFVSQRTVDSHIKGIRHKFASLDESADPVETVFGVGYRARKVE